MSKLFLLTAVHTLASIRADCVGYIVSGAGTPGVDGCYQSEGALYVKDSGHELYTRDSVWRIGEKGKNVSYIALNPSKFPPASPGGCNLRWTTAVYGEPPCPKLQRNGLPPLPPTPAPSPAPRPPLPPAPPPMRLVWEDNFDQDQLNRSRWNILEQVHRGGVYTKENVEVVDGLLRLRTRPQNLTIRHGGEEVNFYVSSGAVNTSGLQVQHTGRWEVRARMPLVGKSPGYTLHSSIWLYANKRRPGNSGCHQEIDVIEQYSLGRDTPESVVAANLHPFKRTHPGSQQCEKVAWQKLGNTSHVIGDFSTQWVTFTVDWTPDYVAMFVNGTIYAHFVGGSAGLTDELFLALTACVMDRVPPSPEDVFPLVYEIDWVRVYEWSNATSDD